MLSWHSICITIYSNDPEIIIYMVSSAKSGPIQGNFSLTYKLGVSTSYRESYGIIVLNAENDN